MALTFGRQGTSPEEILGLLSDYRPSNWLDAEGGVAGGDLDNYISGKPHNEARFADSMEYVAHRLRGSPLTKMVPEEVSRRLNAMAAEVERSSASADARQVALFARYHARKALAGAGTALYYASGDAAALQMAKANAAAGLEIWEEMMRLNASPVLLGKLLPISGLRVWREGGICVRRDLTRLEQLQGMLDRYGIVDLALDFGAVGGSGIRQSLASAIRPLGNDMPYSRDRGYGWSDVAGISASQPADGFGMEPPGPLKRGFLRGSGRSTLLVDLPDGEYRVTAVVNNQPELASGAFKIRGGQPGTGGAAAISYGAGETGEKSMDLRAVRGRISLEFVPEQPGNWLVCGLLSVRRAPHIAHIPIFDVTAGSRTNFSATITAPDGVSVAEAVVTLDGKPAAIPLLADGYRFSADFRWEKRWAGKTGEYFFRAQDGAGHYARWPAGRAVVFRVHP